MTTKARSTLITNIGELVTWEDERPIARNQAVVVADGHIAWQGPPSCAPAADVCVDAGGGTVIPGFVDSHTHLVFAGERREEFVARMGGGRYAAGGIRTTVAATREASLAQLEALGARRMEELVRQGTTTVEIKSGYGLSVESEERLLRVARGLTPETTFLGAHVVPEGWDAGEYVDLVTGTMLDACAPHARWVDVFCDEGAFDGDQARVVALAGRARGLVPRLHANQLRYGPGVQVACEVGAAAADHCTYLTDADVAALADSGVVAGLLPGVEFSTKQPYPSARRLLDAGVTVSLATDCNPGTSYTSSMPFCVALAVREMGMTPTEALRAATWGGGVSLRRADVGHLREGAQADLVVLDAPSHVYLAYRPGVPLVRAVIRAGVWVGGDPRLSGNPAGV